MADHDDSWYPQAACMGAPVDLFFPERTQPDARRMEQARAICGSCPVREACLVAGMAEQHGIWGGLSPSERRVLRRKQRQGAA